MKRFPACAGSAILAAALLASAQSGIPPLRIGVALPAASGGLGLPAIGDSLTTDRLLTLPENGRPTPRLARQWTASQDGSTWTFRIAENVRAHSGRNIDAEEVAALLRRAIADPRETVFHPRLSDIAEISANGPAAVVVRARTPRLLLLDDLAQVTLRGGEDGFGPFVAVHSTTEVLRLRRFDGYYLGPAPIQAIEFRSYRSQRAAWSAAMRDEVDAVYEISRDIVEFVEHSSGITTHSFLRPYAATLAFNVGRPALRPAAIRRAISAAVDRDAILSQALRGRGQVAGGPLRPGHWALVASGAPSQRHDPRMAATLLDNLPLRAGPGEMPAKARFTCLVPQLETQPFERIALILQKQLYGLGIDLQLRSVSMRDLQRRLAAGDFDMVLIETNGGSPGWLSTFWRSPAPGASALVNSGYTAADAELDAMQLARDDEELKRAIAAVYRRMLDDPPAVFIAWAEVARAVSTRIDVPVEQGHDIMGANLRLWRPAGDREGTR